MQYTEKELAKLIKDLESTFQGDLAKAEEDFNSSKLAKSEGTAQPEAPLAKAEDKPAEKPAEDKKEAKPDEKKEEPKSESKEEAPKADAKPEHSQEAAPESKEAAPAAEQNQAPAAEGEHSDYDDEDRAHMDKMYMSMSKPELHDHHDSVRKALDSHGMQKCGEISMSKSEDTKNAAPASIDVKVEDIKTNPEVEILKSEVEAHKAKAEELKKNLDAVQEFLTKLVKKVPQGKAITSYEQVAKSEGSGEVKEFSKSEVTAILAKKAADPSLTKSDRDAINAFYLNGANINTINHLLK